MGKNTLAEKRAERGRPAYTLVDLSDLPAEHRQEILDDAMAGGGTYGIRVVEEVINGPARQPMFGYYEHDADKWDDAKKELGISASDVADDEVKPGPLVDENAEANLRQRAEEAANREADRIRQAEDKELQAITGEERAPLLPEQAAKVEHADRKASSTTKTTNKAPR